MSFDLPRRMVVEGLGTAFIVAATVGSGIMADRLTDDVALALLCTAMTTSAILGVFIMIFGPISGGHFNPAVSMVFACRGELSRRDFAAYVVMQVVGGVLGIIAAHIMFGLPIVLASETARSEGQWVSEVVAVFGLVSVILAGLRFARPAVPWLVGLYIVAAYWFTASTSFANPAVTIARSLTNTPTGIRLLDVPAFVLAQLAGALLAWLFMGWLLRASSDTETNR